MTNHVFASLNAAENYVRWRLNVSGSHELKILSEMPFLTKYLRFSSASLYLDPRVHRFYPKEASASMLCNGLAGELNAMAIFLGCRLSDGLSSFTNARGTAFFIGKTKNQQPVTDNVLWGAAHFIYEAMDLYPDENGRADERCMRWGNKYAKGTWKPMAGDAGVDLYQTDPFKCQVSKKVVDHRQF
ncbi:hypothetical protein PHYBOEH_006844 [Phytophthora boehmeriae]|uniref:Uncharacterized protein n=1 Tax=Phytophthora boehmeriae TaxID=109152 RepID=A0A8T1X335_9STRA|nr:hypothetical protein PHYBOEH_006844 [Phytophthora boehmeriae]